MVPVLTGKGVQKEHNFLYWEFHEGGTKQAVRMGKWKGIRFGTNEPLELYDLSTDLHEDKNVAAQNTEIVKKMESFLSNARTESKIWTTVGNWPADKRRD
jgi:arylsulfatase A-like enzyme